MKAISQLQMNQKVMLDELAAIRRTQNAIMTQLKSPEVEELPADIQLPLKTHEEVDELERQLTNKKVRDALVSVSN